MNKGKSNFNHVQLKLKLINIYISANPYINIDRHADVCIVNQNNDGVQ